ncbi:hypothetical protein HpHA233_06640 [Helicobacter pylori]
MRKHGNDRSELIKELLLTKQKNKLKREQLERIAKAKKKKQLQANANHPFSFFERDQSIQARKPFSPFDPKRI